MDLEKFEFLLRDRALFLCRSDKFSDPFEATTPRRESEYRVKEYIRCSRLLNNPMTMEEAIEKSDEMADLHKRFRIALIINCWHINSTESDAMWRLYLKTNEGVAIQTTYERLIHSLQDNQDQIFVSKVRYLDYDKDIWYHEHDYPMRGYDLYSPIVHKRKAFGHENELRVFQKIEEAVDTPNYWDHQPNKIGRNLPCNVEILIDKIILPPTAEDDVREKVKSILNKYGFKVEIIKSKLKDPPIY